MTVPRFSVDRFLSPSISTVANTESLFEYPNSATMEPSTGDIQKLERRSSAPVKRRVSRACDHCHRMRTRCNGQSPCSRCIELEYVCQYQREKKRRGKVRGVMIVESIYLYSDRPLLFVPSRIRWEYSDTGLLCVDDADVIQVPRHIQKQREEAAAAGHSPQTPNGLPGNGYFERPGGLSEMEMEDEVWSQSEATPIVQHFPGKGLPPPDDWQSLQSGSSYQCVVPTVEVLTSVFRRTLQPAGQPHDDRPTAARIGCHLPTNACRIAEERNDVCNEWYPPDSRTQRADTSGIRQYGISSPLSSCPTIVAAQLWVCRYWVAAIRGKRQFIAKRRCERGVDVLQISRAEAPDITSRGHHDRVDRV